MDIGESGSPQVEKKDEMFQTTIDSDLKIEIVKEEPREGYYTDYITEYVGQENDKIECLELKQDGIIFKTENTDINLTQHSISKLINEELTIKDEDCFDSHKYLMIKVETEDVNIESVEKEQTDCEASLSSNLLIQAKNSNENVEPPDDCVSIGIDKTETAAFQCNDCLKYFKRLDSLKCHQRIHTGEKPYSCKVCLKRFAFNFNFRKHLMTHAEEKRKKTYLCKICFKSFFHIDALLNHEMMHYCKVCFIFFSDVSCTAKHERKHSLVKKSFQCEVCLRSFVNVAVLKKHLMIHTGEKPLSCKFCPKSFLYNSSLISHEKRHMGEKPFACQVCSKSFTQRNELLRHHRSHTGEKPFRCEVCLKSFSDKSSLVRHEKSHFAETLCYCHVCLKPFSCSSTLETHMLIHKKERQHPMYPCKFCSKSFTDSVDFLSHERTHTLEKP